MSVNNWFGKHGLVLLGTVVALFNTIQGITAGEVLSLRRSIRRIDNPTGFWWSVAFSAFVAAAGVLAMILSVK